MFIDHKELTREVLRFEQWKCKLESRDVCRFRGTGITRKVASKRKNR